MARAAIACPDRKVIALQADGTATRDSLVGLLWSERGEAQARQSLRQTLAILRAALDEARDLSLVREVDGLAIYDVLESDPDRSLPRPPQSAGYHCFHEVPE